MYLCVCACVCVCMYVCMYIHIYIYICVKVTKVETDGMRLDQFRPCLKVGKLQEGTRVDPKLMRKGAPQHLFYSRFDS